MKTALGYFRRVHQLHWSIENYHRALKQVCSAEKCFVRFKKAICNHLFCSLRAFVQLELQRWRGEIKSWYAFKRHFADAAVTTFIQQRTHALGA